MRRGELSTHANYRLIGLQLDFFEVEIIAHQASSAQFLTILVFENHALQLTSAVKVKNDLANLDLILHVLDSILLVAVSEPELVAFLLRIDLDLFNGFVVTASCTSPPIIRLEGSEVVTTV